MLFEKLSITRRRSIFIARDPTDSNCVSERRPGAKSVAFRDRSNFRERLPFLKNARLRQGLDFGGRGGAITRVRIVQTRYWVIYYNSTAIVHSSRGVSISSVGGRQRTLEPSWLRSRSFGGWTGTPKETTEDIERRCLQQTIQLWRLIVPINTDKKRLLYFLVD